MSALYSTEILRLATQIPFTGPLVDKDVRVTKTSRICGSRIVMDARFVDDQINALGLDVKACALGQAATAIIAPHLIGMTRADIMKAADQFIMMLKDENAPAPDQPFDELALFIPARAHKSRHGSLMLAFETALAAFDAFGEDRQ